MAAKSLFEILIVVTMIIFIAWGHPKTDADPAALNVRNSIRLHIPMNCVELQNKVYRFAYTFNNLRLF